MGNPTFVPDDKQRETVIVMVGMLVPKTTIARLIGVSLNTFNLAFADEIAHGSERFVASVKAMLVRSAQKGSVRAQTYLLDKLGGPEFSPKMGLGGIEGGAPIQISADSKVMLYLPDNKRLTNDGKD